MRILVVPQEFKGSLTAREAAAAIGRGLTRGMPDVEIELLPLADGGPGTVEVLVEGTGGQMFDANVHDPLGRPARAFWGVLGDGVTAVIETATASGIALVTPRERDPRRTSTFGSGELVRAALHIGYRRLIVGVGGSATNDGGAGLAQALSARLLDDEGRELPPGGAALAQLERIDVADLEPRLADAEIIVASDVRNPLCGPDGASLLYGPQKGASEAVAHELDAALAHYAAIIARDLGVEVIDVPGAGAAGGLGAGLIAFCGAAVRSGFEVVAGAIGLPDRITHVDAVVTGEGRLDRQTAFGKTTAGVAEMVHAAGKPVVAVAGSIEGEAADNFDAAFAVVPDLAPEEHALAHASELVEEASALAGRWLAER